MSEHFSFPAFVFENELTSEHNVILTEVRTTYQKSRLQRKLKAF